MLCAAYAGTGEQVASYLPYEPQTGQVTADADAVTSMSCARPLMRRAT